MSPDIEELIVTIELEAQQLAADARDGRPANAFQAQRIAMWARRLRAALTGRPVHSTVDGMTPARAELALKRATSKGYTHPFHAFMLKRAESIDVAAEKAGVPKEVARAWIRRTQVRKISEEQAAKLEKAYGYKATAKNWPNGIRSKKI